MKHGKSLTRLYTIGVDGSSLTSFPMLKDVSHLSWDEHNRLFSYVHLQGQGWGYYEIASDGSNITRSALDAASNDGHPSNHSEWVITDTYSDRRRIQSLILFSRKTDHYQCVYQARIPFRFRGGYRCDFSRWGDRVCFDSAASGVRSLNILPVPTGSMIASILT